MVSRCEIRRPNFSSVVVEAFSMIVKSSWTFVSRFTASGCSIHRSQAFLRLCVPSKGQGLQTTGLTSSSCQQWDAATDIIIVIVANQQYQESEDRHHYQRGKHVGPCSICRSLILRYVVIMVKLRSIHLLLLVTNLIAKPLPRPPTCLVPALPSACCVLFVWYQEAYKGEIQCPLLPNQICFLTNHNKFHAANTQLLLLSSNQNTVVHRK